MADWQAIKTEYITTKTSYRKLAEKYGVHYKTIADKGKKEKWEELRSQVAHKTLTKTIDKVSTSQADRLTRIQDATDMLLDKIEQAITELNIQLAKETRKEKIIEYNNPERADKATKEIVHETEKIVEVASIIDRQGLKQISAALKDIKEVQMLKSELDRREQEARIANLQKQAEKDDHQDKDVTITISGGDPSWQS